MDYERTFVKLLSRPYRVIATQPFSIAWNDSEGARKHMISRGMQNVLAVQAGAVTRVDTQQRVAALTFDDGPHPIYTPRMLAVLNKHRTRATFFMVGAAAEKYPYLVRSVVERGHAIGNHTWDHPSLPALPRHLKRFQILACQHASQ